MTILNFYEAQTLQLKPDCVSIEIRADRKNKPGIKLAAAALSTTVVASSASADVSGIKIRFGGECLKENTTGKCIIKGFVSGADFDTEEGGISTRDQLRSP